MPNIFIFSLLMLYISVSTSYIRFVSISPKFSLLNLRDKGLNTNLKLLKSNKIVEQAALIHLTQLTQLDMIKGTDGADETKEIKSTDRSDGYLNNLNINIYIYLYYLFVVSFLCCSISTKYNPFKPF